MSRGQRFDRWMPWGLGLCAVILWAGALRLEIYTRNAIHDTPLYERVADQILGGAMPYRDFDLEYPPGAALIFAVVGIVPGPYAVPFSILMLGCLLATMAGVVAIARSLEFSRVRQAGAAAVVALSPLVLGRLLESRYDLALAALLTWMVWAAINRRFGWMWGLLAAAVLVKLIPLALVPLLILWQRHYGGWKPAIRGATAAAAAVVLVMLPFALASPSGLWSLFSYHLDRPLQVESTASSYLMGLHALADVPLTVDNSYGSQGLIGAGPDLLATLSTLTLIGLLVGILWSVSQGWRGARPPGDARLLMAAITATMVSLLVAGKVLSPQFMIWLLPSVGLIWGRYGRTSFALGVVALLLTWAYFPHLYWDLVALEDPAIAILVVRNACLIALLAAVWPRPSITSRPRGVMLHGRGPEEGGDRAAISARYLAE